MMGHFHFFHFEMNVNDSYFNGNCKYIEDLSFSLLMKRKKFSATGSTIFLKRPREKKIMHQNEISQRVKWHKFSFFSLYSHEITQSKY